MTGPARRASSVSTGHAPDLGRPVVLIDDITVAATNCAGQKHTAAQLMTETGSNHPFTLGIRVTRLHHRSSHPFGLIGPSRRSLPNREPSNLSASHDAGGSQDEHEEQSGGDDELGESDDVAWDPSRQT